MPKVRLNLRKPNGKASGIHGKLRKNHEHKKYKVINTKGETLTKCKICKFVLKDES